MWKRKNKSEPEQGRGPIRQVDRSGGVSPAFSYYTNKPMPEAGQSRLQSRGDAGASDTNRRAHPSRWPYWLLVTVLAVCLVKVLLLNTNPQIITVGSSPATVTYARPDAAYADAAHRILSGSIANHTKLTVDLNGTARALERQFPELQAASLGVSLVGSRPIVYVQVARPSLILQIGSANYALNKSGVVLAKLQTMPSGVPIVVDQSSRVPRPGKQFLPSSTVDFMQTINFQLHAAHMDVNVFVLPLQSPYELDARLNGKPYSVRFNLRADALTQSGAAIATLGQLGGSAPGEYLDVRVPGRVYYR